MLEVRGLIRARRVWLYGLAAFRAREPKIAVGDVNAHRSQHGSQRISQLDIDKALRHSRHLNHRRLMATVSSTTAVKS
jgi:hypothetical protein